MLIIYFNHAGVVSKSRLVQWQKRSPSILLSMWNTVWRKCCQYCGKSTRSTEWRRFFSVMITRLPTPPPSRNFLCRRKINSCSLTPHTLPTRFPVISFCFSKLKEQLRGRTFKPEKGLDHAIVKILKDLSENGFLEVFRKWLDCCENCLESGWRYFEEMLWEFWI